MGNNLVKIIASIGAILGLSTCSGCSTSDMKVRLKNPEYSIEEIITEIDYPPIDKKETTKNGKWNPWIYSFLGCEISLRD